MDLEEMIASGYLYDIGYTEDQVFAGKSDAEWLYRLDVFSNSFGIHKLDKAGVSHCMGFPLANIPATWEQEAEEFFKD